MGCGIHALLQKKQSDGKWKTVLEDCLYFCSSDARQLNSMLESHGTRGFPAEIVVEDDHIGDFYIGEHSYYTINMKDFRAMADDGEEYFNVERNGNTISISLSPEENYLDDTLKALAQAFNVMFSFEEEHHRFLIGFDS